jgi:7-cyano-7-deazaguanine reductase
MADNNSQVYGLNVHLGKQLAYSEQYDPGLLQAIPRVLCRQFLPMQHFFGEDIWTAYELSWLDLLGKPCVARAEFCVPASSECIVESKSFKYYLNSLNQTRFASADAVLQCICTDLSGILGTSIEARFIADHEASNLDIAAILVDDAEYVAAASQADASLLQMELPVSGVSEVVYCSHLLKSNCPVTGQPDWASLWIGLSGAALQVQSLLTYIVSYRQHQDFHENCVEKIYCDIWNLCQPQKLWVYARYTRRGGIDINPFRASEPMVTPRLRGFRQ